MSKGSNRRPQAIPEKEMAENWARAFGQLGRSTAASATGSNPVDLGSSPSAPAIYVDDETGKPVS